jgi:hypothetical protein
MLTVFVSVVSSTPDKQQGKEEIRKEDREPMTREQVTSAREQEERRGRTILEEGSQVLGTVLDTLGNQIKQNIFFIFFWEIWFKIIWLL